MCVFLKISLCLDQMHLSIPQKFKKLDSTLIISLKRNIISCTCNNLYKFENNQIYIFFCYIFFSYFFFQNPKEEISTRFKKVYNLFFYKDIRFPFFSLGFLKNCFSSTAAFFSFFFFNTL